MGLERLLKILIHLLNEYLLTAYSVPDAAQRPEKEQWAEQDPCLGAYSLWGEIVNKQTASLSVRKMVERSQAQ